MKDAFDNRTNCHKIQYVRELGHVTLGSCILLEKCFRVISFLMESERYKIWIPSSLTDKSKKNRH